MSLTDHFNRRDEQKRLDREAEKKYETRLQFMSLDELNSERRSNVRFCRTYLGAVAVTMLMSVVSLPIKDQYVGTLPASSSLKAVTNISYVVNANDALLDYTSGLDKEVIDEIRNVNVLLSQEKERILESEQHKADYQARADLERRQTKSDLALYGFLGMIVLANVFGKKYLSKHYNSLHPIDKAIKNKLPQADTSSQPI